MNAKQRRSANRRLRKLMREHAPVTIPPGYCDASPRRVLTHITAVFSNGTAAVDAPVSSWYRGQRIVAVEAIKPVPRCWRPNYEGGSNAAR